MTQRVGVVAREVGSLLQAENRVGVVRRTPELAGSPPEAPAGGELFLAFSTVFTRFCFDLRGWPWLPLPRVCRAPAARAQERVARSTAPSSAACDVRPRYLCSVSCACSASRNSS